MPVLSAGREQEILGLFKPYALGEPVIDGWKLDEVNIDSRFVRAIVIGQGTEKASISLELPKRHVSTENTASFSVFREGGAGPGGKVLDALVTAVRTNDKGHFWPAEAPQPQGNGVEKTFQSVSSPFVRHVLRVLYQGRLGGTLMLMVIALCLVARRRDQMAMAAKKMAAQSAAR